MIIKENVQLKDHHTFHIPAVCRWFLEYESVEELKQALSSDLLKEHPFLQIGGGSNLLFCSDYPGVVLHSSILFREILAETDSDVRVRVGSGVVWDDFVSWCVERQWYGVENLSYIPGEVGASAVQNVGAYGVEAKDVIEAVECLEVATGKVVTFEQPDCGYGYRTSVFKCELKGKYIVTAVVFRLSKTERFTTGYGNIAAAFPADEKLTLERVRQVVIEIRRAKLPDPDEIGSAGSFFMNPVISEVHYNRLLVDYPQMPGYPAGSGLVKVPAAWLIDKCRWRGKSQGGAAVYDKQCLVLVNRGSATANDVMQLADRIKTSVCQTFCIEINPEVNYI